MAATQSNRKNKIFLLLFATIVVGLALYFYASYFESPSPHRLDELGHKDGSVSHSDSDPYHYHFSLFEFLLAELPLAVRNLGPWNHPRGQHMLEFVRR